jgi:UDP-N-acetylenolpyruvoylglucosamine reductase
LIIVSNGQATGTEINAFAQELRDNVKNQTQLDIEPEVVILAS